MRKYVDTIVHRWLRVPYTLHVRQFRSPKNPTETVVCIHGLGNSTESWREVAEALPDTVRVIAIDMLGFGESPKPGWVTYNIAVQARAIAHTLLRLGLLQRPVLVGHSMGALVAIELARRYPFVLKQLVLCSPPLYKSSADEWLGREKLLRTFYRLVTKHPEQLEKIAPLAEKLGVVSKAFNVEGELSKVYVAALEASIINQSSLDDIRKLKLPIRILYGLLDPVIIGSHFKELNKSKGNISVKSFPVGHEVIGRYVTLIAADITKLLS